MKKVNIRINTTVRRTGNHITSTTRVSNGTHTKTVTKTIRVPNR